MHSDEGCFVEIEIDDKFSILHLETLELLEGLSIDDPVPLSAQALKLIIRVDFNDGHFFVTTGW